MIYWFPSLQVLYLTPLPKFDQILHSHSIQTQSSDSADLKSVSPYDKLPLWLLLPPMHSTLATRLFLELMLILNNYSCSKLCQLPPPAMNFFHPFLFLSNHQACDYFRRKIVLISSCLAQYQLSTRALRVVLAALKLIDISQAYDKLQAFNSV